ncbi:hypothetical protein DICPUDRAFT_40381 [Dictyostelium purpureum]|uniref:Armadillo-type fold n=1 Tax=Dictyostelium purpureum TaxID=5786 RepID=F0ZY39_DICPU|nr:uncharacterized protein DICPUDRAFT_40381 [Dictyostelium purpureum]EGC31148.1 hypothetical protein DICPUDRAFT_40381 [Dictyostelium purpureum]|eukprot:XP_003292336.1 hypothetical protein DICPUDRAFT_40381 [Dictyostelium purpureum]
MEEIRKLINDLGSDKSTQESATEDSVENIIKKIQINKNNVEENTLIYKTLADLSKIQDNRETIIRSPSNIIEKTSKLFELLLPNDEKSFEKDITKEDAELFSMICRLIGNLTYENEPNREYIFDKFPSILRYIVYLINQSKYSSVQRTACASIANLSSETDFIQLEFFKLGTVSILIDIICAENSNEEVNQMAIKAFSNIIDNEETQMNIHFKEVERLFNSLQKSLNNEGYYENSFAQDLVQSLSVLSQNKDLQKEILQEGFLNNLLELIENSEKQREIINEFKVEDIEKDKDISVAPVTSELIFKLADNDDYRQYFYCKGNKNIIDRMITIMTTATPKYPESDDKAPFKIMDHNKVKKNITKTVALCSLEDEVIDKFIKTPKIFIDLLTDPSEDPERIINGSMIIGNLARSEMNCKLLNSYNVIGITSELMKKFPNYQPIQHFGLSCIRNLTLPTVHRGFIPDNTLMENVVFNMKVHNQVIQFAAVSLLKNFVGSAQSNFKTIAQFPDALQSLLDLANGRIPSSMEESAEANSAPQQLDDAKIEELEEKQQEVEEKSIEKEQKKEDNMTKETKENEKKKERDMRVVYESTRIILRFVENQAEIGLEDDKKDNLIKEAIEPFYTLLKSPFPILQSEGAKGLAYCMKHNKDLITNRNDWLTDLIETLKVSMVTFQQLEREKKVTATDPNHQRLLQQLQANCQYSNDLQQAVLAIIYGFSLADDSIISKMKEQNIIQELKQLKSKPEASQIFIQLVQKILTQLTL